MVPSMTDPDADADAVAASLADRIDGLTFLDRTADEVTEVLIGTVVGWAVAQNWRAYRRARSVVPLPAPLQSRFSTLDVACARPSGPPVVVEVDRTDRRRTLDKLRAEAAAGRIALWLRWGTGAIAPVDGPVRVVACAVTGRSAPGGRRFDRLVATHRPPPEHSVT
jgi:hypothetical protein